jgi:hypothetical protein
VRVTKAALEALLKIEQQKVAALEEKVGRPLWMMEQQLEDSRLAQDLLAIELEKERSQSHTVYLDRTVTVPVESNWHRRMNNFLLVVLAVICTALLLSACAFMPNEAEPYTPPESYRAVWAQAEACTGVKGSMDRIAFYKMPGRSFESPNIPNAAGHSDHHRIILAEHWLDHPMVVKHEMIHALIGSGHPKEPFEVPCKATWESWEPTTERLAL